MRIATLIAALVVAGVAADARAVALGQVDDFQDGTTQGWGSGGGANPNPPSLIPSGGPAGAGDGFLQIESNGTGGAGSHLVGLNRDQWAGDYATAGVADIFMDVSNPGDTDLFVRLALVRLTGGGLQAAVATASSVFLPASAGWQSAHFELAADDLVALSAGAEFVLADVFELRILSAEFPDFRGDVLAGTLWVDNVSTLPEPAALALLALAGAALRCRRRLTAPSPRSKLRPRCLP